MAENFDPEALLRRATSRAKSDVANKLVAMFLHEISRHIIERTGGLSVKSEAYSNRVVECFGSACIYCARHLNASNSVVEHLDGMNRFRLGLHLPGNVALACKACNSQKRRDDQMPELLLADTGWESFLSHDGTRCVQGCKSCAYWQEILQSDSQRREFLTLRRKKIAQFRMDYGDVLTESSRVKDALRDQVANLYRDCQKFAEDEIAALIARIPL